MNIIIAPIHICLKTGCTARKMASFITYQDLQAQVLAGDAIKITIIIYVILLLLIIILQNI